MSIQTDIATSRVMTVYDFLPSAELSLDRAVSVLPENLRPNFEAAWRWFIAMSGTTGSRMLGKRIPGVSDDFPISAQRGIHVPSKSGIALSVTVARGSIYSATDQPITKLPNGTWVLEYSAHHNNTGGETDNRWNDGLVNCLKLGLPVGVFIQKSGSSYERYLAYVEEYRPERGVFTLRGPITAENSQSFPTESTIRRPAPAMEYMGADKPMGQVELEVLEEDNRRFANNRRAVCEGQNNPGALSMDCWTALSAMSEISDISFGVAARGAKMQSKYIEQSIERKTNIRIDTFVRITHSFGFDLVICGTEKEVVVRNPLDRDKDLTCITPDGFFRFVGSYTNVSIKRISQIMGMGDNWFEQASSHGSRPGMLTVVQILQAANMRAFVRGHEHSLELGIKNTDEAQERYGRQISAKPTGVRTATKKVERAAAKGADVTDGKDREISIASYKRMLAQLAIKLLDYSLYNNLLSYKDESSSSISIAYPNPSALYHNAVNKGMAFEVFTPKQSITIITRDNARKTLGELCSISQIISEKYGLNTVYLSFGMLSWVEKNGKAHRAPLVLVPTILKRNGDNEGYTFASSGSGPFLNPVLRKYISQYYKIDLPSIKSKDSLEAFLRRVERAVKNRPGWRINHLVILSTFLPHHMQVYWSIVHRSADILSNPLDLALLTGKALPPESSSESSSNNVLMSEGIEVSPNDSIGLQAASLVRQGKSFKLQGEDNYKRTKVLAAIVGGCLARGKSVLLVAHELSALESAHIELTNTGFGEYCIHVRDDASDTMAVAAALLRMLNLRTGIRNIVKSSIAQYEYAHTDGFEIELNTPLLPLGISPKTTMEHVAEYQRREIVSLDCELDFASFVDGVTLKKRTETIGEYADCIQSLIDIRTDNEGLETCILDECKTLEDKTRLLEDWLASLDELLDARKRAVDFVGVDLPATADGLNEALPMLTRIREDCRKKLADIEKRFEKRNALAEEFLGHSESLCELDSELAVAVNMERIADDEYVSEVKESLVRQIERTAPYTTWSKLSAGVLDGTLSELNSAIKSYDAIREIVLRDYRPEVFDLDAIAMEQRFGMDYRSMFKRLFGQRAKDIKTLSGCRRDFSRVDDTEAMRVLGLLHDMSDAKRSVDEHEEVYAEIFGQLYRGVRTDVGLIERKRNALAEAKAIVSSLESLLQETSVPIDYEDSIRKAEYRAVKTETLLRTSLESWQTCSQKIELRFRANFASTNDLRTLADAIRCELDKTREREAVYRNYCRLREVCEQCGLAPFVSALHQMEKDSGKRDPARYVDVFLHTFYRIWFNEVAAKRRPLLRGAIRSDIINELISYENLAKEQGVTIRTCVESRLLGDLQQLVAQRLNKDEVDFLAQTSSSRKAYQSIADVLGGVPHLLPIIKPCLLMSPLTACEHLKSVRTPFDVVIMEEASTIKTEEAFGVIAFGKQLILSFDPSQKASSHAIEPLVWQLDEESEKAFLKSKKSSSTIVESAGFLETLELPVDEDRHEDSAQDCQKLVAVLDDEPDDKDSSEKDPENTVDEAEHVDEAEQEVGQTAQGVAQTEREHDQNTVELDTVVDPSNAVAENSKASVQSNTTDTTPSVGETRHEAINPFAFRQWLIKDAVTEFYANSIVRTISTIEKILAEAGYPSLTLYGSDPAIIPERARIASKKQPFIERDKARYGLLTQALKAFTRFAESNASAEASTVPSQPLSQPENEKEVGVSQDVIEETEIVEQDTSKPDEETRQSENAQPPTMSSASLPQALLNVEVKNLVGKQMAYTFERFGIYTLYDFTLYDRGEILELYNVAEASLRAVERGVKQKWGASFRIGGEAYTPSNKRRLTKDEMTVLDMPISALGVEPSIEALLQRGSMHTCRKVAFTSIDELLDCPGIDLETTFLLEETLGLLLGSRLFLGRVRGEIPLVAPGVRPLTNRVNALAGAECSDDGTLSGVTASGQGPTKTLRLMDWLSRQSEPGRAVLRSLLEGRGDEEAAKANRISVDDVWSLVAGLFLLKPSLHEDSYVHLFEDYDLTLSQFCYCTEQPSTTYRYLELAHMRGSKSFKAVADDNELPKAIRERSTKCMIGAKEPARVSRLNLEVPQGKLVNNPKYDRRRNRKLALATCRKIANVVDEFVIDGYEYTSGFLFDRIRSTYGWDTVVEPSDIDYALRLVNRNNSAVTVPSTGVIRFGNCDRRRQLRKVRDELGSDDPAKIAAEYERRYGMGASIVRWWVKYLGADWLKERAGFSQRHAAGRTHRASPADSLEARSWIEFLQSELDRDCCDRSLVTKRFRFRFPNGPTDPFSATTLRRLGFKTRGKKLLLRQEVDPAEYFESLISSRDRFSRGDKGFENAIFNDPLFRRKLRQHTRSHELIEYERDSFIALDSLCNAMQISPSAVKTYSQDVSRVVGASVPFTIYSLRHQLHVSFPLDTLATEGGVSDYLFETLLDIDPHVQTCSIAHKRCFIVGEEPINAGIFLERIVEINESMDFGDLEYMLLDDYGIKIADLPLHNTIRQSSLYYDDLTECVYTSKKEWEEMVARELA